MVFIGVQEDSQLSYPSSYIFHCVIGIYILHLIMMKFPMAHISRNECMTESRYVISKSQTEAGGGTREGLEGHVAPSEHPSPCQSILAPVGT